MSRSVLLVEDEPTLAKNIRVFFARHDIDVSIAESGEAGLEVIERERPEAVILDYNLPGISGLEVLRRVRERLPDAKVVMLTGQGSEQVAVDAMKAGAVDYFTKPIEMGKLRHAIARAITPRTDRPQGGAPLAGAAAGGVARLVGRSAAMQALRERIVQVVEAERGLVDADVPAVLVTGETGTGKELVARALHLESRRANRPFVEVNCSGIPANLLESELFGYERGAFTDARESRIGLIESADGGTLFLDEIGELELGAQAKLLKLMEDKQVRRLGSVKERRVDVRIVAATNRDLEAMVREGRFRADLFFRLRMIEIATPALRMREADAVLLAEHFLELHRLRYGKPTLRFAADVAPALAAHRWPGNVRELRNLVEQCVVLARGGTIAAADLALDGTAAPVWPSLGVSQPLNVPLAAAPAAECGEGDAFNLPRAERDLLLRALEQSDWNVSKAARLLGVSRDTLRYRIEKFQLKLPC